METTATFTISSTGTATGNVYTGKFVVKTLISVRDIMMIDEQKRAILGSDPANAEQTTKIFANMVAQLRARIVEAPEFWMEHGEGLDIVDYNVLVEIYKLAIEKEDQRKADLQKQAEEARKELRK